MADQQGYTPPQERAQCRRDGDGQGVGRPAPGMKKGQGDVPPAPERRVAVRYTSSMLGAPAMGLRPRARKATRQTAATTTPIVSAVWMPMPKPILGS